MKLTGNNHWPLLNIDCILEVKGHSLVQVRGDKDIHVNAGVLKSVL